VRITTEDGWPRCLAFDGHLGEQDIRQGMNGYAANPNVPPPLPVWGELSGNSRPGFETKNPAWHSDPNAANSTTTMGFRASLFLNFIREIHSARYYNPATGRFMSRDPNGGNLKDPASLHKYLYANGDPVNGIDPMGQEDLMEYLGRTANAIQHYNTFNNPSRLRLCQAQVYAGIAALIANPTQLGQTLGAEEVNCAEELVLGIISPVPNPPAI
jgi:RHS repeat-associated protein